MESEEIELSAGRYRAKVCPSRGMNLVSIQYDTHELIDPSTRKEYLSNYSGLAPLICPHFYERDAIPKFSKEQFPFAKRRIDEGKKDPFSHGICRYAPWQYTKSKSGIKARIQGSDMWNGVALSDLEGFDFEATFDLELTDQGIHYRLSVQGERPCIVGQHYYYQLPAPGSILRFEGEEDYFDGTTKKRVPQEWKSTSGIEIPITPKTALDYCFHIRGDTKRVTLASNLYDMHVEFSSSTGEPSCQVYRPANASYICIEPNSAALPRRLELKQNALEVSLLVGK